VYISDEEAGTIALRENAGALRASLACLPNVAHCCNAFVDARHPEHLRCVGRIRQMAVVAFKVVDGHGRKSRTGAPLTAMPINHLALFRGPPEKAIGPSLTKPRRAVVSLDREKRSPSINRANTARVGFRP